jgi:hypothetical protein
VFWIDLFFRRKTHRKTITQSGLAWEVEWQLVPQLAQPLAQLVAHLVQLQEV